MLISSDEVRLLLGKWIAEDRNVVGFLTDIRSIAVRIEGVLEARPNLGDAFILRAAAKQEQLVAFHLDDDCTLAYGENIHVPGLLSFERDEWAVSLALYYTTGVRLILCTKEL